MKDIRPAGRNRRAGSGDVCFRHSDGVLRFFGTFFGTSADVSLFLLLMAFRLSDCESNTPLMAYSEKKELSHMVHSSKRRLGHLNIEGKNNLEKHTPSMKVYVFPGNAK